MEVQPLVSVIIPVYNAGKFLSSTLNSVFAQTYPFLDVIVVNDGSTDNSAEIAQSYPNIRYFDQSNQGVSVARNVGISVAKGEFIAFLDADDIWKPDKLSIQINYMLKKCEVGITWTKALNILEPETHLPSWFNLKDDLGHLGEVASIIPSTWVVRNAVFNQIGNFSIDYRSCEDTEWLLRARDYKVSSFVLPDVLTIRRLHGANLSWHTASTTKHQIMKILRESIARKLILNAG